MEFHPTQPILASGSRDCTVKLFDYSKVSAKKASRTICDAAHIETISFHPNGTKEFNNNGPLYICRILHSLVKQFTANLHSNMKSLSIR